MLRSSRFLFTVRLQGDETPINPQALFVSIKGAAIVAPVFDWYVSGALVHVIIM